MVNAPLTRLAAEAFGDGQTLKGAIAARRPAVISDLAAQWPALTRWSPKRLTERYGEREVRVYDASFGAPGPNYMGSVETMSFGKYLEEIQGDGRDLRMFLYNISQHIPEMLDDIILPQVGLRFSQRFVFTFFGCRGSTTPLHYDIDRGDVLHTVVRGRRRIRLFSPRDSAALYRHPFTVRSYVDLDHPDYDRHPAFRYAAGYEVILEPGETLYMPSGWWHEFYYLEAGVGVSLRAASPFWSQRIRGALDLLLYSPIDRLGNRVAAQRWYDYKVNSATRKAAALCASPAQDRPSIQD